jgi:hypothetical protein
MIDNLNNECMYTHFNILLLQFLIKMLINTAFFWDVMMCSVVGGYQYFGRTSYGWKMEAVRSCET